MASTNTQTKAPLDSPEVVSFGMVVPATLVVVDRFPQVNTGVTWREVTEFISDDAAIVATALRSWGVQTGLIGTALGTDAAGRRTVRQLKKLGIAGDFRTSSSVTTPFELNISDGDGNRTYFWRKDPNLLATLDGAGLSLIHGAKLLYVDWYDGEHILRPMKEAAKCKVPTFLNIEHGHQDTELLANYAPYVAFCQAVTDRAQRRDNAREVAQKVLDKGLDTVLVTTAAGGCLGATREHVVRVHAPRIEVVDGCGAGAIFSAGFIYGYLHGWSLERKICFAVAAASLKCTVVGPRAFPLEQIRREAGKLKVEHAS